MKKALLLPALALSLTLNAQIAITEFLCNPSGSDTGHEWLELFNYSTGSVNIKNWTIEDEDFDSDIITTSDYTIASGDYVIIASNKDDFEANWLSGNSNNMVFGVPIILGNNSDELILKDDNGTVIWNLAYGNDETQGNATFFTEDDFSTTDYGDKASPGVDRDGNDVTGKLGFEKNNATSDGNAYTASNGDLGSPLLGDYTPLPIRLSSFSARKTEDKYVVLHWSTASEENNDFFAIEHSVDGRFFEELDRVLGAGTSSITQHYEFMHRNPVDGNNYYRLRQVDFDGSFTYSDIKVVNLNVSGEIKVKPTLVQQNLEISINEKLINNGTVEVVNWLGQVVMIEAFPESADKLSLDVNDLEKGHYVLKLNTGNGIKSARFIKL